MPAHSTAEYRHANRNVKWCAILALPFRPCPPLDPSSRAFQILHCVLTATPLRIPAHTLPINPNSHHVCSSAATSRYCTASTPGSGTTAQCVRLFCCHSLVFSTSTTPSTLPPCVPMAPYCKERLSQQPLLYKDRLILFKIALFEAYGFGNSVYAIYVVHDLVATV